MYKVEILWGIKWMDTEKSEGAERTERWTKEQKKVIKYTGIVKGPRSLEIPGAGSYLYSLFLRFGMIKKFACDYDGESL